MGRLIGTTTSYSFLTGRSFTNAYTYDAASNRIGTGGPGFVVELWVPRSFRCGGKGGVFDVIANPRSPYGINANQPGFLLRIE
jgi:hypothetical protein